MQSWANQLGSHRLGHVFWALLFVAVPSKTFAVDTFSPGGRYDDYGAFTTDPVDLDNEFREMMGRYFQSSFNMGTGIYTGQLAKAHAAGVMLGLRFSLFVDRTWAAELSGSWARNPAVYNEANTGLNTIDVGMNTTLIPVSLAIKYAFDSRFLPRGLSLMNPYFVGGPEIVFRSESISRSVRVDGIDPVLQPKFAQDAVTNSNAWGFVFGGGAEFDLYQEQIMVGIDLRYHLLFWPDAADSIGNVGRTGDFFSVLAQITYNY